MARRRCARTVARPATIARRLAAVRAYLRHLTLIGTRADNPAAAIAGPRRPRTVPRTLSPAEAERLVEAANGTSPRAMRDRALVELLYGAGLRVSEAVGLVKAAVDLEGRIVRVTGKGGKERLVPLGRPAAEALRRYLAIGQAAPRPASPPRPVSQRARRRADPRRRVPHPPPAGRPRRPRAWPRAPAPASAFVRHAPARGRRRPPKRPGDARPRRRRDDGALHAHLRPAPARRVLPGAPARPPPHRVARRTPGYGLQPAVGQRPDAARSTVSSVRVDQRDVPDLSSRARRLPVEMDARARHREQLVERRRVPDQVDHDAARAGVGRLRAAGRGSRAGGSRTGSSRRRRSSSAPCCARAARTRWRAADRPPRTARRPGRRRSRARPSAPRRSPPPRAEARPRRARASPAGSRRDGRSRRPARTASRRPAPARRRSRAPDRTARAPPRARPPSPRPPRRPAAGPCRRSRAAAT